MSYLEVQGDVSILWAWDMSAVISYRKLMEVNSNDANTQATGCQIMQHLHLAGKI